MAGGDPAGVDLLGADLVGAEPAGEGITDPVAVVQVDTGLPHLDRPFEYAVPAALAEAAQPGVRVKVRFAGRDSAGYVLERRAAPEHPGRLAPLRTVVSDEPVLTPTILALARNVAGARAGTVGDVLRLAIPPRHARAENALAREAPRLPRLDIGPATAWAPYAAGPALLRRLTAGEAPAASWLALPVAGDPGGDWPTALAQAAAATLGGGRGSIVVVPDHRDVERLDAAMTAVLGPGRHVRLTSDQGPQARYTAWLKVLRGHVSVVVGNRASAFAPVRDLGLIAVWDDGDDLHEEPRAPYPQVRDVALARARLEGAAIILGGYGRTVAVQHLVEGGSLKSVAATTAQVRSAAPRVEVAGEDRERERDPAAASARLPSLAWRVAKAGLATGPVLVQVPRRGYVPSLACASCRAPARCTTCRGPLEFAERGAAPSCRWCGRRAAGYVCPTCESRNLLRAVVTGARRTAEELGRAFPGFPVVTSGGDTVLADVPATPRLVIATPGAEPVAAGGYAAALLLDAWALLDRPTLNVGPETLRRWLGAAALVRSAPDGGTVVVCGAPPIPIPALEALVRWDPAWLAARELADRVELDLPPAVTFAEVIGPRRALLDVHTAVEGLIAPTGRGPYPGFEDIETLGLTARPDGTSRLLMRALPDGIPTMVKLLTDLRAARSARKEPEQVTVRVGIADI